MRKNGVSSSPETWSSTHTLEQAFLGSQSLRRAELDERREVGLIIRDRKVLRRLAEVLPDDPTWHWGLMPTLIHTMPIEPTWNGRPDPLGGAANGMLIEANHVSILGLRILGLPVVESPRPGQIRRLYAVSRLRDDLDGKVSLWRWLNTEGRALSIRSSGCRLG